jgi:hypothetical protein
VALENKLKYANEANRRGLLLGLTLSEIMMIILFALLLLFGSAILEQDEEQKRLHDLEQKLVSLQGSEEAAMTTVGALKGLLAANGLLPNEIEDILSEMRAVEQLRQDVQSLKDKDTALSPDVPPETKRDLERKIAAKEDALARALKDLQEKQRKLAAKNKSHDLEAKMAAALVEAGVTPEQARDANQAVNAMKASVDDLRQRMAKAGADQAKIDSAIEQARKDWAQTALDNRNLGEQAKYWKAQWEKDSGKGKGVTPCWATNGVVDFIFDVALYDNGITIRKNNDVPQWADDYARLPVGEIPFMMLLTQADFLAKTRPLFDYSVQKDCRFFVRLYDETSVTAKLIYQQRRRSVEGYFFILDMKAARFGAAAPEIQTQ